MAKENPYKGDTLWGDFKGTALGGFLLGLGRFLIGLAWFTIVGALIYYSMKAVVLSILSLFGRPLPSKEEFPHAWYLFGWVLVAVIINVTVINFDPIKAMHICTQVEGTRYSDTTPQHRHNAKCYEQNLFPIFKKK